MSKLTLSLRSSKLKSKNLSVIQEGQTILLFRKKIKRVHSKDASSYSVIETRSNALSF